MATTIRIVSLVAVLAVMPLAVTTVQAQGAVAPAPQDAPHRGIGVAMQGSPSGEIEVVKIAAGSPAEKAGVKIGDKVISVAGISVFDFDPETAKSVTDTAKTIDFVVMRGDQKLTFHIIPALVAIPKTPQ